ncbi:MAG: NAD(P)H-hydrate dehydratase [Pirellulales bacterium]|nr:NAD(P)H-hydrate dehydratase [Pirellulales bacterium]
MPNLPLPKLMPRPLDSHKGVFGHVLLVGGSRGMAGAISLSGMAALRSGAGLVTLATPETCVDTVAGFEPSYMTVPLLSDAHGRIAKTAQPQVAELARRCTTIGCGPGMQRSAEIDQLVAWLYQESSLPMVADADALNALSAQRDLLPRHAGPRIVTPHPGEFARLLGIAKLDPKDRTELAIQFARRNEVVVVLKGHRTIVADGAQTYVNETGNPGMATGGCGDVLTGIIAALAGQDLSPFQAAQLGVYVHGLAGDLAAAAHGETSLIASDLVRQLPEAFKRLDNHQP